MRASEFLMSLLKRDLRLGRGAKWGRIIEGGTKSVKLARGADGSIYTAAIPEPTTASLSLLALAALCACRRRR